LIFYNHDYISNQVFYVLNVTIIDFDTRPDTQQGFGAISNTCPILVKKPKQNQDGKILKVNRQLQAGLVFFNFVM
jgi:hypothetical protein